MQQPKSSGPSPWRKSPERWVPGLVFFSFSALLLALVHWESTHLLLTTKSWGSDAWEHLAAYQRLLESPFHPSNPHLVSSASSPRYTPLSLAVALLGKALGLRDSFQLLELAALLNTGLLLLGLWLLLSRLSKNPWAPHLGLFATLASSIQAFHYSNVTQLSVYFSVASYPSNGAWGLSLILLWLCSWLLDRPKSSLLGLLSLALLGFFLLVAHPLTAMAGFCGAGLMVIFHPQASCRRKWGLLLLLLAGFLGSEFWPYFSSFEVMLGGRDQHAGWVARSAETVVKAEVHKRLHPFYRPVDLLSTLGLALFGAPIGLYFARQRRHLFASLSAVLLLIPFGLRIFTNFPLGHRFVLLSLDYLILLLALGLAEFWGAQRLVSWRRNLLQSIVLLVMSGFALHNLQLAAQRLGMLVERAPASAWA